MIENSCLIEDTETKCILQEAGRKGIWSWTRRTWSSPGLVEKAELARVYDIVLTSCDTH